MQLAQQILTEFANCPLSKLAILIETMDYKDVNLCGKKHAVGLHKA